MLMEVKNQIKVIVLSIKYNIIRQMENKVTFITNILFMILNNATFIIQWLILFSIKNEIGGYTIKEVILLWGIASGTYGIAHLFFNKAFELSELIVDGKLDTFLVQPKSVYLSVITSSTKISAFGDLIYGYICLIIYGINILNFLLFTCFIILGGIIITAFSTILHSLSFWVIKSDILADSLTNAMINLATYPGTVFKKTVRILLYTIIPVGIANYMTVDVILKFNFKNFVVIIISTIIFTILSIIVFYRGLKRYSSSNLMGARL